MRKTQEELQTLMIQNDATSIFSWSKFHTFQTDPYGYLLKYILKTPEDKNGNAYSFMGGFVHSLLEDFYDNKIDSDEMLMLFDNKIFEQKLMDIRFDSSDDDKNDSIGDKYVTCVKHFLHNYIKDDNAVLEKFVYLKLGRHLFQGYIDKIHTENNTLFIDDFKTSTIYTGAKVESEKGQLLLYTIAISEMYNIPYDRIKTRWNFLKYVSIDCEQVNGKIATTNADRCDIAGKLRAKLKTWFNKFKYSEEDFEKYYEEVRKLNQEEFIDTDCLEVLPDEIKSKFKIKDCLVEITIDVDEIEKFKLQLHEECDTIIEKEKEYAVKRDDMIFWTDVNKSNSYYFFNLCGYSPKYHAPLKKYLDEFEEMNSESIKELESKNSDADFLKSLLLGD